MEYDLDFNRTRFAGVNREGIGLQIDDHTEFAFQLGWYLPQVPAGKTSAILEFAVVDLFPAGIHDDELGLGRPAAVDSEVRACFARDTD